MQHLRRAKVVSSMVVALALVLGLSGLGQPARALAEGLTAWNYTALGDSLATGVYVSKGYVPRYQEYTQTDTGASVSLTNLGKNGWTSTDLLHAIRTNETFRTAIARADVLTWDIGGNDLRVARSSYKWRSCGGTDNQDCLRAAEATLKKNWDAIIAETLSLRTTSNTIIRTMDIYNPFVKQDKRTDSWKKDRGLSDFQAFKPYVDRANAHISTTAAAHNIPYAQVYGAFNGPKGDQDPGDKGYLTFDGLHPNDTGHKVIADLLRALGYAPLR